MKYHNANVCLNKIVSKAVFHSFSLISCLVRTLTSFLNILTQIGLNKMAAKKPWNYKVSTD